MSDLYSQVIVVDPLGEELVRVKIPGVPRNDHVFLIRVGSGYDVQECCRIAAVSALNLSDTPASEADG